MVGGDKLWSEEEMGEMAEDGGCAPRVPAATSLPNLLLGGIQAIHQLCHYPEHRTEHKTEKDINQFCSVLFCHYPCAQMGA